MLHSLSISLVVYRPDFALLSKTLQTLNLAVSRAEQKFTLQRVHLCLVDNSNLKLEFAKSNEAAIRNLLQSHWSHNFELIVAERNLGYGAGHNLAIRQNKTGELHLIINPDVLVDELALIEGISYLKLNPLIGMVSPLCYRPSGEQEYLCKSYPSVFVLLLRGFAPDSIRHLFFKQLQAYDQSALDNSVRQDVLIASGCFMLCRSEVLRRVDGFCEDFFLYFEDFDLSLRFLEHCKIAFVPAVKIVHFGGASAKKGLGHIGAFVRSAALFFSKHGWRFL